MFVDREKELEDLQQRYATGRPEFFVLYGRRRVGKTALLREFVEDKPHLFFTAAQVRDSDNREAFRRSLLRTLPDLPLKDMELTSWDAALEVIASVARRKRLVLILDEFPYLCEGNASLPSILQRWWDTAGRRTKIFLVLSGSYVSFMEKQVLAERSPLYGRRTGQLKLRPLPAWAVSRFFPGWSTRDRLTAFGLLGGIPGYLERFDPGKSWRVNLLREAFRPQGFLFEEVPFLLRMELDHVATYLSLLTAIAAGATRLTEIAARSKMTPTSLTPYLGTLQELGLVRREVLFTETRPDKSKRGIYRIDDPFVAFWCRFVLPQQSLIQSWQGRTAFKDLVEPYLDTHLGGIFEEVCRRFVAGRWMERFGDPVRRVGRLWGREYDFDLVAEAADRDVFRFLVGECKWWRSPVGVNVLEKLKWNLHYLPDSIRENARLVLFGSSGFTPALRRRAAGERVVLVSGKELLDPAGAL